MRRLAPALPAVMILVLLVLVVRTAWVSDDAFITLRTLDNLVHGHGLRYNPLERVQAFTHPLWLAVLAVPYATTGEPWLTTMAVGAVTTLLAAGLLAWGVARQPAGAWCALAMLGSSKAWVDYTTSGLENPLVWLLLALFARELYRDDGPVPARLVLAAALLGLTRLDALVLVAPALAVATYGLWRVGERRSLATAQLAWAPLLGWHAFALLYYGSWAPNTAWAKLGTGIPATALATQSWHYFAWTARNDPVTLPAIAVGLSVGLARRDLRSSALALGAVLYLAYVVRVGGDFMAGRFFTAPLWVAALLVARSETRPGLAWGAGATALLASLLSPWAPLRSGAGYHRAPAADGVVDERGYYWRGTGLWTGVWRWEPTHEFARDGRAARVAGKRVVVKSVIGLYGYYAGPGIHVVDRLGLSDPLLARLPTEATDEWRIGHFRREIPRGYTQSVLLGTNRLVEPDVHALYGDVLLATRAPLWSRERLEAVLRLESRW